MMCYYLNVQFQGHRVKYEMTKTKQNKETVGTAWRLLQYCYLQDKISLDIKQYIWSFSRNIEIYYLFYEFSRKRSPAEPWLGNTGLTSHFIEAVHNVCTLHCEKCHHAFETRKRYV